MLLFHERNQEQRGKERRLSQNSLEDLRTVLLSSCLRDCALSKIRRSYFLSCLADSVDLTQNLHLRWPFSTLSLLFLLLLILPDDFLPISLLQAQLTVLIFLVSRQKTMSILLSSPSFTVTEKDARRRCVLNQVLSICTSLYHWQHCPSSLDGLTLKRTSTTAVILEDGLH